MNHGMRQKGTKIVTSEIRFEEWMALRLLAVKANLSLGQYVRAIIKDVIYEEATHELQCSRAKASPSGGEASQANRGAAS